MSVAVDFRIPDVVGEISGFRAWKVHWCGRVPALFSINTAGRERFDPDDLLWPTNRWFEAKCPRGHLDEIPVESCSCGLYAAKSIEQLVRLRYGAYGRHLEQEVDKAVGEVAFAGKVIEGTQGWRAEKGRIVRLWVPLHKWKSVEPLSRAYNVPVSVTDWRQIEPNGGRS